MRTRDKIKMYEKTIKEIEDDIFSIDQRVKKGYNIIIELKKIVSELKLKNIK